jgi:hypothetical protein
MKLGIPIKCSICGFELATQFYLGGEDYRLPEWIEVDPCPKCEENRNKDKEDTK